MRTCTALFHVSVLPAYAGESTWNCGAGLRRDAIHNTQPSGY